MDTEKLLLTIPEVSFKLGLSRTAVYQLVMNGEIASVKVGRARRVSQFALLKFLENKAEEAILG